MKSLKDLRMTLRERPSGSARSASTPVGGVKHASSLQPPKQVIRAARSYESRSPSELSFHCGDFFHVVAHQKPGLHPGWIEACNPMTNARGLVPESHFEILQRSSPTAAFNLTVRSELNPNGVPYPEGKSIPAEVHRSRSVSSASPSSWFATVKYDFYAERPQELDAKEGDSLLIVARSDLEWLVGKPLGRLGQPGLIPIGFIVFCDTITGEPIPSDASQAIVEQLPTVQQWQEKNERYLHNAIPLGKLDLSSTSQSFSKTRDSPLPPLPSEPGPAQHPSQSQPHSPQPSLSLDDQPATARDGGSPRANSNSPPRAETRMSGSMTHDQSLTTSMHFLPAGLMTTACVDAFHYEPNDYWYRLRVTYVTTLSSADAPDKPQGHEVRDLVLYRLYEDFVEFHMSLSQELMGSSPANDSILLKSIPSLPPTVAQVDERAAAQRRSDLDLYLRHLSACPEPVLRSAPVRGFLELRPGDRCKTSVSVSKPKGTRTRVSDQLNHFDSDLAARLQGLNTASGPKRHSPNDSVSPTSSKHSSGLNVSLDSLPYYRIKVMRRDDPDRILAVRMPPQFSRRSLLRKVQERLGSDIRTVHTDEQKHGPMIVSDDDVHAWISSSLFTGKKLFLYADK
ncbi:bud emergence protein 1 [Malassezia obtusa]|uniref:Bud emergence protein 1 n=1 Tax=Malassezia obtusa TaxID=76774 RepID=A0AAF0E238_9BASI|nr:bud emergence protein 1 [Malassezia obtusa]